MTMLSQTMPMPSHNNLSDLTGGGVRSDQEQRIEHLEQQLEKAKELAEEQNQQMQWLSDYYKEEIEHVRAQH